MVEGGLEPGDRVIVTNLDSLRDGSRVILSGDVLARGDGAGQSREGSSGEVEGSAAGGGP